MIKALAQLTKVGIILFAVLSGLAGFALSYQLGQPFDSMAPFFLVLGLTLVSGGSFAINQAQEWRLDVLMERTKNRPIPRGVIAPWQAYLIGALMITVGLVLLAGLSLLTAGLALLTVILYNGIYTLLWKKHWIFGAVPGAIPGAMPVLIGYSVNSSTLLSPDALYLFLILFLWQMPHFWCLAIRFRNDYASGGLPVLPTRLGVHATLYHMSIYLLAYVGVALAAPWFLKTNFMYLFLLLPVALKLLWEFMQYYRANAEGRWLPFFMWTNFSVLVFLSVPVVDKWVYWMINFAE